MVCPGQVQPPAVVRIAPAMTRFFALLRRWPRLPQLLLVGMLVIGLVIETTLHGAPRWLSKLPVALLIGIEWLLPNRGRRAPLS